MCAVCKNNLIRNSSHIITNRHRRNLINKFKEIKKQSIEKYGYYKWVSP